MHRHRRVAARLTGAPAVVGDELFANLQKHFSNAQLVELVSDLAMGNMRSRFNRAFLCRPAGFSEGAYCPLPEK